MADKGVNMFAFFRQYRNVAQTPVFAAPLQAGEAPDQSNNQMMDFYVHGLPKITTLSLPIDV